MNNYDDQMGGPQQAEPFPQRDELVNEIDHLRAILYDIANPDLNLSLESVRKIAVIGLRRRKVA